MPNGHTRKKRERDVIAAIRSDDRLRGLLLEFAGTVGSRREKAAALLVAFREIGVTHTPQGIAFTLSNLLAALRSISS
jgi:hypothetical protein